MASELKLVSKPIVEIKNLTKEFDFVRALDDVSLEIPEGHIIVCSDRTAAARRRCSKFWRACMRSTAVKCSLTE